MLSKDCFDTFVYFFKDNCVDDSTCWWPNSFCNQTSLYCDCSPGYVDRNGGCVAGILFPESKKYKTLNHNL